jgi:IclR family transcriptional regulator, pca regulon regulatory protein
MPFDKQRFANAETEAGRETPPVSKSTVLSLAKGFRVLESFNGVDRELTLTEIARRADLDPGTAFRLVKTLVSLGYVQQVEGAKRYILGLKVLDLGFNAIARMDLHTRARPILRSLVGKVNEAASIGVLDGPDVVYIERVHAGLVRLGVNVRIGSRIPAYCSAIGRAILAYLPKSVCGEVLAMRDRVRLTARTLVTLPEIEGRLRIVRRRGYEVVDEETVNGLRAMAAPVLDADGHPHASVSVTAASVSLSLKDFVRSAETPLLQAASELSRLMNVSGATAIVGDDVNKRGGIEINADR